MTRRRPKPHRRRALELLAACHDGATEAIMRAHGLSRRIPPGASPPPATVILNLQFA